MSTNIQLRPRSQHTCANWVPGFDRTAVEHNVWRSKSIARLVCHSNIDLIGKAATGDMTVYPVTFRPTTLRPQHFVGRHAVQWILYPAIFCLVDTSSSHFLFR